MYESDIFTEPSPDPDSLAHLGPLAPMAGTWEGEGLDTHPVASGSKSEPYAEHYELQPIDPQTNGPQLLYGLRYHTHIVKPGETETFHDQVGYWLWEPATRRDPPLGIPRGQVLLQRDRSSPTPWTSRSPPLSVPDLWHLVEPFLDRNFRTLSYRMHVTVTPTAPGPMSPRACFRSPAFTSRSPMSTGTRSERWLRRSRIPWRLRMACGAEIAAGWVTRSSLAECRHGLIRMLTASTFRTIVSNGLLAGAVLGTCTT